MASESPSPTDFNGRDGRGRFGHGNKLASGNPFNKRVQQIRAALFAAVKPSDIRKAVRKQIEQAIAGDRLALAEILDRTLGKAIPQDVEDRLSRLEQLLSERQDK